jgi:capsular exopolysaccharide synthesis family protein
MTVRDHLHIARVRWRFVVAGLLAGLALAMAATMVTPPRYAAQITIYISAQTGAEDAVSAYQGNLLSEQKVKSYAQLLTGHRIATDVVAQLGLDLPPERVRESITASARPQTVLLMVTVTDDSPELAQRIADAVGVAFGKLVTELERPADPARPPAVTARVVEAAQRPVAPVSPQPVMNLGLGALLGLLLGAAGAALRHAMDTSVKTVDQLRTLTGAPNLGAICYDPDLPLHPLVVHQRPRSPMAEAFRQVRTNLQFIDVDRRRKVVLFTSAVAEEGKTTTLCNLGIALAQAGNRVLLVEGDLRRPRVTDYLGLEGGVGVTSLLSGRVVIEQALQPWGADGLTVLASGPVPPNPSELVASAQMATLLAELRARYDVVLVDAPPLLPVTDAAALGTLCDGALLVVRAGRTASRDVTSAMTALDAVSVRLLGTVLTMAPAGGPDSYSGYYTAEDRAGPSGDRSADGLAGRLADGLIDDVVDGVVDPAAYRGRRAADRAWQDGQAGPAFRLDAGIGMGTHAGLRTGADTGADAADTVEFRDDHASRTRR